MSRRIRKTEKRLPIERVLTNLRIHSLPDMTGPVDADFVYLLIKYRDADGLETWSFRTSSPPNSYELLGALSMQVEALRQDLACEWDLGS